MITVAYTPYIIVLLTLTSVKPTKYNIFYVSVRTKHLLHPKKTDYSTIFIVPLKVGGRSDDFSLKSQIHSEYVVNSSHCSLQLSRAEGATKEER